MKERVCIEKERVLGTVEAEGTRRIKQKQYRGRGLENWRGKAKIN